ncbi:ABC transporter substrate-binding protein [Spirillospora sp. NPDC048911]|uniref:peptide ABC transporter substrate-binding protein n=1 Tax=Spirillospora sp. NPDC048911 TaxID=3364527 RepID=UPI00371AA409
MKSTTRTAALLAGGVVMLVSPVVAMKALDDPADPRVSVGAAPAASLMPGDVRDGTGRMIAGAVWTGLVAYDPRTGVPANAAAEAVTSDDRKVWTVKLKAGGRFHDGSPVTARSFTGAWSAVLREGWAGARLFTEVAHVRGAKVKQERMDGLKVVDDLTFKITLDRPMNGFPALLGDPAFLPMPDGVLRSRDWASYGKRPIGNGPYRVRAHDQRETVLDRDGARTIVVKTMPDAAAQYAAVQAGDLDLATAVPANRHESMEADFRRRHLIVPGRAMTYLAFPQWEKRLTNPSIRQAMSMAIDRNAVSEGPLGYQTSPANALVPPGVLPGRRDEGQCRPCVHDPAASAATLADAGGLSGPVPIWYEAGAGDDAWVKAVADQLRKQLKLDAQPKAVATAELQKALADRKVDGPFVLKSAPAYPAPIAALAPLVDARTGYDDDYALDLIGEAERAATPDEAVTPARLAETALLRDMPAMPLWTVHDHLVWSERLRGVTADAFTGVRLDRLTIKD